MKQIPRSWNLHALQTEEWAKSMCYRCLLSAVGCIFPGTETHPTVSPVLFTLL